MSKKYSHIGPGTPPPLPITEGRLRSMYPPVVVRTFARLVYKDCVERIAFVDSVIVNIFKDKFDWAVFTYDFAFDVAGVFADTYTRALKIEETDEERRVSIAILLSVMFKKIEGNETLQPEITSARDIGKTSIDALRSITGLMLQRGDKIKKSDLN